MIIDNLKDEKHVAISNRTNPGNNYTGSSGRLLLFPLTYTKLLVRTCLKNAPKGTVNGLVLRLSKKFEK